MTPDASLPAVHALHLAEVAERWHVSQSELFEGLGLSAEHLADPSAKLALSTYERLGERARELTGEPALGFYLGLQMRISAHGYLGFAAMTAATVRESLEIATRYAPTRTTAIGLRLVVDRETASLFIDENVPLGSVRDIVILSLLTGIWQIGNALTGHQLVGDAELSMPEPSYFHRFRQLSPGTTRFDQPAHRLVFPAKQLDLPLAMSDPVAQRLAREQCERELESLGFEGDVVGRCRALLPKKDAGVRPLAEVARALHVSPRTLKRRLASRGTSYSALLEEHRRERAMLLLGSGGLGIEQVAHRLGYSDAANFTRAFRRWTGLTPRAFRASQAGEHRGGGSLRLVAGASDEPSR